MHNRKKPERDPTETEKQAVRDKAHVYRSLVTVLWEKRKAKDYSPETLGVLNKLLVSNPDFYSLWNFRREVLFALHPTLQTLPVGEKVDNPELRETELTVTAAAIRKNPKSYGAWHHRLWIVDRFVIDYDSELSLCKDFLMADQRNFHCWNYRRAVFQRSGLQPSSELDFCLDKIQENFSNYSAFHHRSIYIKFAEMSMEEIFNSEWPLIENAIYTEPDDQSAWWYYQFLVTLAHAHIAEAKDAREYAEWLHGTLSKHMEVLLGLIDVEETSRWPHMILVFLIDMLLSAQCRPVLLDEEIGKLTEDRGKYLEKLIQLDPIHEQRYQFLLEHNGAV